jgi:hypothetical protein
LKITFNHAPFDLWNEDLGELEKPLERWATVAEVVEELEQELQSHPYGVEAKKARWRAKKWAEKFSRLARDLREKGKTELAKENEDAAQRLVKAVGNSLEIEQDKWISDLDNITDSTSKNLVKACRKALLGMAEISMSGGDEEGKLFERTRKSLLKKYEDRIEKQLEKLGKMSPDDPKFDEHVRELVKSNEQIYLLKDADASSRWEVWREKNATALEERYKRNPALDKEMKSLLRIHVLVFDSKDIPESLSGDSNIKAYWEQLQAYVKQLRSTTEGSIELTQAEISRTEGKEIKGEAIQSPSSAQMRG